MDDQLQQQLAAYLKEIATAARAGADFAIEQAPLVVQEKIAYARVSETAFCVLAVLGAFIAAQAFVWGTREGGMDADNPLAFVAQLAGGILCVVLTIGSLAQLNTVMLVWFAPRLYILEWVMGLLK